jgi:hypothetical protein
MSNEIIKDCEADYTHIQYLFSVVVLRGPKALRRTFLSNWKFKEGTDWTDTADCGRKYWEREKSTRIKRGKEPTRSALKEGNSLKWDFTALKWILADSSVHPLDGEDRDDVIFLSKIRNDIAHVKPEGEADIEALISNVNLCSHKLVRLCRKFASDLETDFLDLYDLHQAKIQEQKFKENPQGFFWSMWTAIKNLHTTLQGEAVGIGDESPADVGAYKMADSFFDCKGDAESSLSSDEAKAAEIADLAKRMDSLSSMDSLSNR